MCHLHHNCALNKPVAAPEFLKTVLQQVSNDATYKYSKSQEYQDLDNSSVAVMLREVQREVNMGHPCECMLHIFSTNNHLPQLDAADDLD